MTYIQGINLTKRYGRGDMAVTALENANFEIQKTEFVAIMGESGSGKSTLLSILGTLNQPSAGELRIDGVDVYGLSQDERADFRRDSIGFVFQNFNLVPYLTLEENVMLPLAISKKGKKEKKLMASSALDRVGLANKGNRLPNQISGGEQERVAIARAIVNNPSILLADEPTGNLDTKTGGVIMDFLHNLNQSEATIVMVTHSHEYARYAQRVIHISDGLLA